MNGSMAGVIAALRRLRGRDREGLTGIHRCAGGGIAAGAMGAATHRPAAFIQVASRLRRELRGRQSGRIQNLNRIPGFCRR